MRRTPTLLVGLSVAFSIVVTAAVADEEDGLAEWIAKIRAANSQRKHSEVIRLANEMIRRKPDLVFLYAIRGDAKLKSGDAAGAIADYDRQIKLDADARDPHWQRGIAYYYAGEYEKGEQQFAWYQNYDSDDVENVVFHFACRAQRLGLEEAREAIFDKPADRRIPMSEIYDFYLGKLSAEEVLAAAKQGDPTKAQLNSRLMYANLYLGLYYDALGDEARAKQYILAADSHKVDTYMWDVAQMHAKRLQSGVEN